MPHIAIPAWALALTPALAMAQTGTVVVPPPPPAVTVQVPLPPGTVDAHDATEDGDPRGLPRLPDYVIGGLSRHTISDRQTDDQGRPVEAVLGRLETREYRLDRYARRPPAAATEILRHYRRMLERLGGRITQLSADGLEARFLRGDLPVRVTLRIRDGGKRYDLSTSGDGAEVGTTATVAVRPAAPPQPTLEGAAPTAPLTPPPPAPADTRSAARGGFSMPPEPVLWPPRGTRGMAVLLVGPGVHRASAVRFGGADAEILARETARVRLRVPTLPEGAVPVVLFDAHGSERLKGYFEVMAAPRGDAAWVTVPPCDGRPETSRAGVQEMHPGRVRPGQRLTIRGRHLEGSTHVSFTVARHEVDPALSGLPPDLVGLDFGASGRPRSAPRWLDTLAAQQGSSHGVRPAVPGECDPGTRGGHAAAIPMPPLPTDGNTA